MPVERAAGGTSLIDVLDRVLDKGIVIDAWVRVSLVGIDLITVEARVVVASIDTYIKYSEAVGSVVPASRPAVDSKTHEAVLAENQALRAQLGAADGAAPATHDAVECAERAVEWLAAHAGVRHALCAAVDAGNTNLIGLAGHGLGRFSPTDFRLELEQRSHPLVSVLTRLQPTVVPQNGHTETLSIPQV